MNDTPLDDLLQRWDALYNAHASRGKNAKRSWPRTNGDAAAARRSLRAIAKRVPQAVVKITGGGKGSKGIAAHLRYISRNGALELRDQDGIEFRGSDGRRDILEGWENTGLPAEGRCREAFNIVLSPGKGADGESLRQAAAAFAREKFAANHVYVMALHTPDTDPSFRKSEHPHVHLVVRARGFDGRRLNPRKADLFAYREAFARHLRDHGVASVATRREATFNRKKGERQATLNMKRRGALPQTPKSARSQPDAVQRAVASEQRARELYVDLVAALAKSQMADDRELGRALRETLNAQLDQHAAHKRGQGR